MVLDKLSEGKAMGEYRKKPVVIEAVKFDGTIESILPLFKVSAVPENIDLVPSGNLEIQTLEGVMTASIGDWIIRGVKGELYPASPRFSRRHTKLHSPPRRLLRRRGSERTGLQISPQPLIAMTLRSRTMLSSTCEICLQRSRLSDRT